MDETIGVTTALPGKVCAIGIIRDAATHQVPIRIDEGLGLAPLAVLDADGVRALRIF